MRLSLLPATSLLLAALTPGWAVRAAAQTPTGDGLRGDYYAGREFERYVGSRRDTVIDFNWREQSPVNGVPAEYFSVRWTGWLLPPASGEYVLGVLVDDGARLWLDGRQLLNEWRGQRESLFQVKVPLRAGQPYRLRLDYCQYGWDTRALLSWQRPGQPTARSVRNLWGLVSREAAASPVPTRYLFSRLPAPPPKPRLAKALPTVAIANGRPMAPKLPPVAGRGRRAAPRRRPAPPPTLPRSSLHATHPASDTARAVALANRLASGQALTLRTLYFEQGKAELPLPVQASLDTLVDALRRRPALRLQVQGHTDNQGDSVLNRQLSQRRAEVVCRYLVAHGIAAERLRAVGLGGTRPVADNQVPAQRAHNRRVVLLGEP